MPAPPDLIRSRSNPLVRRLRALKDRAGEEGRCLLEGIKLVEEALGAGIALEEVAASPLLEGTARGRALLGDLEARGLTVRRLEDSLLASLSEMETSQGILALARRPEFDEEAIYAGLPLVLVLAGVQQPGNVGALLRTAEAAGATGAYLTEGTADPFSWKALRGSMGSAFRLPHRHGIAPREALRALKAHGVRLAAAVPHDSLAYDAADLTGPLAIVLGGEGPGLAAEWLSRAELRLSVPMAGRVESLNVAAAAAVLLFEAGRQRRRGRPGPA